MRKTIFCAVILCCLIFAVGSPHAQNTNPQIEIVENFLTDMPTDFFWANVSYFTIEDKIYIFGGRYPILGSAYVIAYDEIKVYDILNSEWSVLPFRLPYEHCFDVISASYFNNHFYLSPGFATDDNGGWGSHNRIIDVDLLNETADETHAFPTSSRIWGVGNCEADGKIYFFGGHDGSNHREIYEYDPNSDVFQEVAKMIISHTNINPTYAKDGWIYYSGFHNSNIERFNPSTYAVEKMNSQMPYTYSYAEEPFLSNNWHIPEENAFYFFESREDNPTVYKYDYANDQIGNTGIVLDGKFAYIHAVKDKNNPNVIYAFKMNPDIFHPLQICKLTIRKKDEEPPTINVTLNPNSLWPPNHKLAEIHAAVEVADNQDPNPVVELVSIESNELDEGLGDGDKPNDIQEAEIGTEDYDFKLRAERSGKGDGRIYTVTYRATDASGNSSEASATVTVAHDKRKTKKGLADLENQISPNSYQLFNNYPNPFNPTTEISFVLPEDSEIILFIYNTSGQLIRRLVSGQFAAGTHRTIWNATDDYGIKAASGIYIAVLRAGNFVAQNKLILTK